MSISNVSQENNDIKNKYIKDLTEIQVDLIDEFTCFDITTKNSNLVNPNRIIKEISSLSNNLPITWETSVFLRTLNDNISLIKFLIIGPEDTPYENGCYEFHMQIPYNYPNSPPECKFVTTNNGSFRFNPNLYANGKVCLSLLGTWSGHESEKWNPDSSNLMQLFISIQSLILCQEPYFNEPGYETRYNTSKKQSIDYNNNVEYHNYLIAIINTIENPTLEFKDVIMKHFSYKKNKILEKFNNNKINNPKLATLENKLIAAFNSINYINI